MTWTDEPSDAQITALYSWMRWDLPTEVARSAVNWLRDNATRKEVSSEMTRIRGLHYSRKLNQDTAFSSEVWERWEGKK